MGKILILILTIGISIPSFASVIHVEVLGMVCGFCTQGIKRNFSVLKAVKSVDVSFENSKVRISLNNGFELSNLEIQNALADSGFSAGKIVRE